MDNDIREILVTQQKQKALRFLQQADDMYNQQRWDLAANRYYYACFHAVQGLFISDGISGHSHSGAVTQFSLNYVKTGKVDKSLGSYFARMMQLRQKADYNCAYDVSEDDLIDIVKQSHLFVDKVIELIDNK